MDPNIALAIVILALFVGVVYGYYTVKGSGIAERPYNKVYGGAPGAQKGKASASGKDELASQRNWTRGTR
jgi:hypothetical protein